MRHGRRVWRSGRLVDRGGTSLIELMVGLVLTGLILIGLMALLRGTQLSYSQGSAAADLQGDVRAALDQVTHDLRRAGRDPRGLCVFATFTAGDATSLQIQRDLDSLGSAPGGCIDTAANSEERITYTYDAGPKTLTRQAGHNAATVLARNVETVGPLFIYHYLPASGSGCAGGALASTSTPNSTQLNCTRRVTVTLRANVTAPGGDLARTVRTDVDLRSR